MKTYQLNITVDSVTIAFVLLVVMAFIFVADFWYYRMRYLSLRKKLQEIISSINTWHQEDIAGYQAVIDAQADQITNQTELLAANQKIEVVLHQLHKAILQLQSEQDRSLEKYLEHPDQENIIPITQALKVLSHYLIRIHTPWQWSEEDINHHQRKAQELLSQYPLLRYFHQPGQVIPFDIYLTLKFCYVLTSGSETEKRFLLSQVSEERVTA